MYNGNYLTMKQNKKKTLRKLAIKSEKLYFYLQFKKRNSPRHVEGFILFVVKSAFSTINRIWKLRCLY